MGVKNKKRDKEFFFIRVPILPKGKMFFGITRVGRKAVFLDINKFTGNIDKYSKFGDSDE